MRKLALHAIVILLFVPTLIRAQQKEQKVLFVGNSYTYGNNLAHIVSIISEGTDTKLVTRKTVIGGAHLWEHWNGHRDLKTREMIANGDFDIVVLQDYSMSGINTPDSTLKYVKLFSEYNEQHGAETYLFKTWARPTIGLFTADGSHPTPLGTLLTACIFVKAITGELPEDLPRTYMVNDEAGESLRLMGADPLDSEFCTRITNEIL